MDKFIVILPQSTAAQQNSLTKFFADDAKANYWHWSPEVWLVSFVDDGRTTINMREQIKLVISILPPPPPYPPIFPKIGESTPFKFGSPPLPSREQFGSLRDMLGGSAMAVPSAAPPGNYVLVIRFRDGKGETDWAGYGPATWTAWFEKCW
jgi:hypothetical protein